MISLLISLAVLLIGYFVYGRVTEKVFSPDDRATPVIAVNDGVDCVPMKTWKAFLIQLLNIAGTGPITSGDTAFRSARLVLAETFRLDQKKIVNRLIITIPLLAIGGLLTWFAIVNDGGFQTVWRYFSWSNQTLAMIALWVSTAYLLKEGKYRFGSLITALPAAFMTAVSVTCLLTA